MAHRRSRLLATALFTLCAGSAAQAAQPQIDTRLAPALKVGGLLFRDSDRDGKLSPFEDWRLSPQLRAKDLVTRMTLEEKAGTMMYGTAPAQGPAGFAGFGGAYDVARAGDLIDKRHVTTLLSRLAGAGSSLAAQNNALQLVAARTRLGVPLTLGTDPRNHFQVTAGASVASGGFSQWPEATGLAAIGDPALTRQFADQVRREYRAVGLHQALSPMADLATEPRWPRINGTFGEDLATVQAQVKAYVQGLQAADDHLAADGVSAVVKHWAGYGAAKDGFDSHNHYGRYAEISTDRFNTHALAFSGAFEAGVAGVMTTYSILQTPTISGKAAEPVGGAFNKPLIQLLRGPHHFDGPVITDWAVINDCPKTCAEGFPAGTEPSFEGFSTAWGVETLGKIDRIAKAVDAGVDQFGGADDTEDLVAAVKAGKIAAARLDQSATRLLKVKFEQGLFEDPFVDEAAADAVFASPEAARQALQAQGQSMVVLKAGRAELPHTLEGAKVFLYGVNPQVAKAHGLIPVDDPALAAFAVVRTATPFETLHPSYVFGRMQHEGSLAFKADAPDTLAIRKAAAKVPTVVVVNLDRPAILTDVAPAASVLLADFGASDEAVLQVLEGKITPKGRLPFELPSSMSAVESQKSDTPHDSRAPLYDYGFGLPGL